MNDIASQSSQSIEAFRHTLHAFNKDALSTSQQATIIENTTFITLAKIDHIMYKSNTYIGIINGKKGDWNPGDQHACRLGKWYTSGMGRERFSHFSSFKAIAEPHAIVHNCAHENFKFIEDGDHTVSNKKAIIENFTAMEKASHQLFTVMDELIQESELEMTRS
jgi:hypothetical protein